MTFARVRRITHGGWDQRIHGFDVERLVTSYAVVTERFVVLVDTLHSPNAAASVMHELREFMAAGGRTALVVNTHSHWDHSWGNCVFAGPGSAWPAPIVGHRRGAQMLISDAAQAELARRQAEEPETFGEVRLQPATLLIDGETTIDGGDVRLVVTPTPGHEPDHLSVFIPELRALFAGDAAEWPLPFVGTPDSLSDVRTSLQRMVSWDPAVVFYAHGHGRTSPDVLRANAAYFDELERRVRAAPIRSSESDSDSESDPEVAVAYPFEDIPGVTDLDAEQRTFYRDAHHNAIRAMLRYVRGARD